MMSKPKRGSRAEQLQTAERRDFVLEQKKAGATHRQIAAKAQEVFGTENLPNNYDFGDVANDLSRLLQEGRQANQQSIEEMRDIELSRLDALHSRVYPVALGTETVAPDLFAVDRVLKISKRRGELTGMDAPQKQEISVTGLSDDDLLREAAVIVKRAGGN